MMIDIIEVAKKCPDINLTVRAGDLIEMGRFMVTETKQQLEQAIADAATETYPTPTRTAEIFDVDLSTLWRWRKQGYLVPIEVGGKRRYRMSDIKRILEGGKK